jgi:oxygen-independent coproporphyrinogen-3 oxidase
MHSLLGIYVHIPFCQSKCHYCNFASGVYPEAIVLPYLHALREEILEIKMLLAGFKSRSLLNHYQVDTVYLGGGTPSLIDAVYITKLLQLLREVFNVAPHVEVTLEVNPGSVNRFKVEQHVGAGVNRVSIGMQTFQNEQLKRIGRSHCVADSLNTLALYREAGVCNISLDLIAGLPGQSSKDWRQNLQMVETLAPDHISMYLLEIHENTRFGKIYGSTPAGEHTRENNAGEETKPVALPDDEQVTEFYEEAVRHFEKLGYRQYEISNFARPGRESRHNLKYWTDQPFIGFGCGAYSCFDSKRWGNERSVGRYIELIRQQQHAIDYQCDLSLTDRQEEAIFLGLRLSEGIRIPEFRRRFGYELQDKYRQQISYLSDAGLVEFTSESLRLTPRGRLLSNEVFTEFLR